MKRRMCDCGVLRGALAVALIALLIAAPARAALAESDPGAQGDETVVGAQANVAEGTWGTCPWIIDAQGTLTIYPGVGEDTTQEGAGYYDSDTLPDWNEYYKSITSVKILEKNGSRVVAPKNCSYLFSWLVNANVIDLGGLDTSSVTSMESMFEHCGSLISVDLSGLDTSSVTSMESMFGYCGSLISVDLSGLDTSSVTSMASMFYNCSSLVSLDLSGFDTSKVEDMRVMFCGCESLVSLDLSGFDTSSVTAMWDMFNSCYSLVSLDLSGFDTSSVTAMTDMFGNCYSLVSLDLSGFDTSKVENMRFMFNNCYSLVSLDLSGFETSSLEYMDNMFNNCSSLAILDFSKCDTSKVMRKYWQYQYVPIDVFPGCSALRQIKLGDRYQIKEAGMFPAATAANGKWFSQADGRWYSVDEIVDGRSGKADTYLSSEQQEVPLFSDISNETAHAADIVWLAASGISKGWDVAGCKKEFRPYANVARADMAAFLFRLAKGWGAVEEGWAPSAETRGSFSDVTEDTAHHDEIWWLAESGISRGWDVAGGKKEFRPYADVARADMAAFIGRLAALAKIQSPAPTGLSFADVDGSTAHREEIQWLADAGVSKGWDNGDGTSSFRPYASVARADMAAFLHRLDGLKK